MSDSLQTVHIDPVQFGRVQAEVEALRRDADKLLQTQQEQIQMLQKLNEQLTEARGGWKMLMLIGGASATFGALVSKILAPVVGK